jgi:serine/threonine protein kinase
MKKNSIFYLNHAVSKPAVQMSLDELKKLQEPSYSLQRNSIDYSPTDTVTPTGIKEFTCIETEKNILGIGQYCTVYKGTAAKRLPELANKSEAFSIVNVAVKIGNGGLLSNVKIKLEAQILSQLKHDHIIQFIHESERQKVPILVLEYLPLGNLYEYVRNKNDVPKELWLKWSKQITDAINYVHHYGIIHNDVKPHNIMVSSEENNQIDEFRNAIKVV